MIKHRGRGNPPPHERMMQMNPTKKLFEQSIMLAADAILKCIKNAQEKDDVLNDAQAIKILAEAYDLVHRGKRGE